MTTQSFSATEEELELATQILVTRGCNGDNGVLQADQAKEVFNRSKLPPATLRVIWNMSNETGNHILSKHEIAKALRLIGWAQAGVMLSEKLSVTVGPLPTLDGITNDFMRSRKGSPQITEKFPPVNEDQIDEFKAAFQQAGPVGGLLSVDKIRQAYMMAANLSYENIRAIINLIDRGSRHAVDFTEFACGLYFVKALQSSQLHSLPSTIPQDLFNQFEEHSGSQPPPIPRYRPSISNSQPQLSHSPRSIGVSKPKLSSPSPPLPNHHPSSPAQSNIDQNDDWEISQHDRNIFEFYFRKLDENDKGFIERKTFDEFVLIYRVPAADLDRIWELATSDQDFMNLDQFKIAMYLVKQRSAGKEIPASLPLSLLPPSLHSTRRNTITFSSLSQRPSIKKPPPVPPKRRDSLMKRASLSVNIVPSLSPPLNSVSVSPPLSRPALTNPFRQSMISSSFPRSPILPSENSPFDDPMTMTHSHSLPVNGLPHSHSHSPQPSPPAANHDAILIPDKSKDEISRFSRQIEVLLGQLEGQKELRTSNDALRLENEIFKTQVKEMEKMMADILAVNESESVGSQEKYAQDITRLMGELGDKEAQCEDQERKLRVLADEEKEMRTKLREFDAAIARQVAEAADYRRTIDSLSQQIHELNARIADMSKVLAEPESNRHGTTSNRELRVLIRDVTRENDSLKSEVRDMHRSMEQLLLCTKHAKHDEMELENRRLKKSVGALELMVTQLQNSVGLSSVNHGRSPSAETLARENEHLKLQLQDGKQAFADFRSSSETRVVELQQKIEALTQEINRLKVDIQDANEGAGEDGSVPPPAYDDTFVPPE